LFLAIKSEDNHHAFCRNLNEAHPSFKNSGVMKKITIRKMPFRVETDYARLTHADNPMHILRFEDMIDRGTHYEVGLHKTTGQLLVPMDHPDAIIAEVPQLVTLDPDGMRRLYGLSEARPLPSRDAAFKCNPILLSRRIERERLPRLTIAASQWTVHLQRNVLQPIDIFKKPASFGDMRTFQDRIFCLFDINEQQIVPWRRYRIANLPDHVKLFELPSKYMMDPVGWARMIDKPDTAFVHHYPLRPSFEALLVPVVLTPFYQEGIKRRIAGSRKRKD
jgi:hypothetical protein